MALCALTGCASQPPQPAQSKWTTATIETHWVSKHKIGEVCHSLGLPDTKFNGCARSKPSSHICEVYAVEPSSFDDTYVLETFGHEVWHCLGAKH